MAHLTPAELAAHHADQYQRLVDQTVSRLRGIANELEQRRERRGSAALGQPPHASHAADVHHAITWGVANLPLEHLLRAAGMADAYDPGWVAEIARHHKLTSEET